MQSGITTRFTVLFLASGTAFSQVITLIALPIITAFYTPEEFGIAQSLEAYCQIFAIGGILALDRVLPRIRSMRMGQTILILACLSVTGFSVLAALIILFSSLVGLSSLSLPFPLVAGYCFIVIAGRGMFQMLRTEAIVERRVFHASGGEISRALALASGKLALGALGLGAAGLLIGEASGVVVGFLFLLYFRPWRRWSSSVKSVIVAARKWRSIALFEGVGSFFKPVSQRGLIIVFGALYGASNAGLFALALLLTLQPVQVVVAAISDVARRSLGSAAIESDWARVQRISLLLINRGSLQIFFGSALTSVCVFVFSYFALPENWKSAADFLAPLTLMVCGLMMVRIYQVIFSINQSFSLVLITDMLMAALPIAAATIGWWCGLDVLQATMLCACTIFLYALSVWLLAIRNIRRYNS